MDLTQSSKTFLAPLASAFGLLLCYWLAWRASALFGLRPNVSAVYLLAGVTTAVGMIGGLRWLPAAFVAIVLVRQFGMPAGQFLDIDAAGALRQVLLYGGAGLLLRRHWVARAERLSLRPALEFVIVAFLAVTLSSLATLHIPPFIALAPEERGAVFLAFWGGDFAGLMLGLPATVLGWNIARCALRGQCIRNDRLEPGHHPIQTIPGPIAFALVVSLIALWLPGLTASGANLSALVLLPVLLAGLLRGARIGYLVALVVCMIQLGAARFLDLHAGSTIDLQVLLAVAVATALLAGAAHDDRLFEWQRANFDLLTGLANRHRFHDQLEHELLRAARTGEQLALMYIDLDGFKAVNDQLGHHAGDTLLQQLAQRLRSCVRETDTVARLGGDEFAIILPELKDKTAIDRIGHALIDGMRQPVALNDAEAAVSASIGVAFHPQDGRTATELIHSADRAMYEAKRRGRNRMIQHHVSEPADEGAPA